MNGTPRAGLGTPAAVLLCCLASLAFWLLVRNDFSRLDGLVVQGEVMLGHDFLNVWSAGWAILGGKVELLYDIPAYRAFQEALVCHSLVGHNYSYPPLGLPLTVPFGAMPYGWALASWTLITGAMFVAAARPWMRDIGLPAWIVLLLPASIVNAWNGHYGFLIGALWLWGFAALDQAPRRAGILFGLIAIKPHLGILLPVVLALRREWTAFAAAAATVATLVLLSIMLFGIGPWRAYFAATAGAQAGMIDAGSAFFASLATSSATAAFSFGLSAPAAFAIQGAIAVVALGMLADVARRPSISWRELGLLSATASFLLLPYAFDYDLTVVSLAALWTLSFHRDRLSPLAIVALVVAFFGLQVGFVVSQLAGVLLTPLALIIQMVVQWRAAVGGVELPFPPSKQAQA